MHGFYACRQAQPLRPPLRPFATPPAQAGRSIGSSCRTLIMFIINNFAAASSAPRPFRTPPLLVVCVFHSSERIRHNISTISRRVFHRFLIIFQLREPSQILLKHLPYKTMRKETWEHVIAGCVFILNSHTQIRIYTRVGVVGALVNKYLSSDMLA